MDFEWDEKKRLSNITKHGLDFIDVWQLFEDKHIAGMAKPGSDGEQRFLATGFIHGICVTGIYTVRNNVTRIISLRKARRNEQKQHQALHNG